MTEVGDLSLILDAGVPIVSIQSPDEQRVVALLARLGKERGWPARVWSCSDGLRDPGQSAGVEPKLTELDAVLRHIATAPGPALYVLCDAAPHLLRDPRAVRRIKDAALLHEALRNTLILVDDAFDVPSELGALTASFSLRLPSDDELKGMIRAHHRLVAKGAQGASLEVDSEWAERWVATLRGCTEREAEELISGSVFADEAHQDVVPAANRLKLHLMDADGVLRLEPNTESFAGVAGLHVLRAWLELRRRQVVKPGRDRPKGLLLLGVNGSGKSLAARAAAGLFRLPLLRLDFGVLESKSAARMERNLRNALRQAELMAPCVLWMDEIERGFAVREADGGAGARLVSTLLAWMAENSKPVFLIATSNQAAALPDDLIRKGRLDEVFFVDLPDAATRSELLRVHLNRRGEDPEAFDLSTLAAGCDGYTGAEIERAVVVAHYRARSRRRATTTSELIAALRCIDPIARVRADELERLRGWAKERTAAA